MKERLRQALSQRQKIHIINPERLPSAVILPIYCKHGQYHVLLTKRTERVKDHKGQISFPGGAYEKRDGTLTSTALRECSEEIGLASEAVELLGELDDTITTTSPYIISPFVAEIPWPYLFKRDPIEVEEIIEAPLADLLAQDCLRQESEITNGLPVLPYSYSYDGKVVWGATARILNQFLGIWASLL